MLLGSTLALGSLQAQLQKQASPPVEAFLFLTSEGNVFMTSNLEPLQVQPNE